MKEFIPAVICAGGHGKVLRQGKSKLGDLIGGMPILARVINNTKAAGYGPIIVVVNPILGDDLRNSLEQYGHTDVLYAYQPYRRGAANAVHCALPILSQIGAKEFLTVFGEMPFISPETLIDLREVHWRTNPELSMLVCPHDTSHPLATNVQNYCYLKQGWDSSYSRKEPFLFMHRPEPAEQGDDIIGNIYIFNHNWFAATDPRIKGVDTKRDGFGEEYHLPKLIELAVRNGGDYVCVRRPIQREILGINTVEDYSLAAQVFASS